MPLREPLLAAHGTLLERELVLVILRDGPDVGYGEAAPLPSYDGWHTDDVLAALAADPHAVAPAAAALDQARLDLQCRRDGVPLWQRLGAGAPPPVALNATIGAADRARAAAQTAAAARAGFGTVKVKVGLGDDAGRVAAVRAAGGPELQIRLDANGAWTAEQALATLRALEPAGIECCEEPCHGLAACAEVSRASLVPIALDESARLPGALDARHADAVCLKVAGCGGVTGLVAAADRSRRAGYEVYLASSFDGPLGIAAALHATAVVAPDRPCGLATLAVFDRPDPLPPSAGALAPPPGPGLGDGLLSWYGG